MRKFAADVARRSISEAPQRPFKRGRVSSAPNSLSPRRLHRTSGIRRCNDFTRAHRRSPCRGRPAMNDASVTSTLRATIGSGAPLHEPARTFMEMSFGTRFDQVRVHTDDRARRMAQTLGAEAFVVGRNIYFNAGRYAPDTGRGKKLLAHELVHTIQQGFHDHIPADLPIGRSDDPAERQADSISSEIIDGISLNRSRPVAIHSLIAHRVQPTIQMAKVSRSPSMRRRIMALAMTMPPRSRSSWKPTVSRKPVPNLTPSSERQGTFRRELR